MKIIDLLNKIANREELPERIKVAAKEFYICRKNTIDGDYDYQDDNATYLFDYLTEWDYVSNYLVKDIEIIEEHKEYEDIKKIEYYYENGANILKDNNKEYCISQSEKIIIDKVNKLIESQKEIMEMIKNENKN